MTKFFTKEAGTGSLETLDNFVNGNDWFGRNEEMNMVWHNFKSQNFNVQFFGFCSDYFIQPVFNLAYKDRPPSFGTPYQMVVQKIHMMFCSFILHVDIIHPSTTKARRFLEKIAIHPLIKIRGFLAKFSVTKYSIRKFP